MGEFEIYRCEICGNMVVKIKDGGGPLVCCGKQMTRLEANTTDASLEKHVPVVTKEGGNVITVVGSAAHPMLPDHYIQWIALVSGDVVRFKFLQPGMEPKAEFCDVESGTIYEYCNLHGLWKTEF
jgi:superoxide reductase